MAKGTTFYHINKRKSGLLSLEVRHRQKNRVLVRATKTTAATTTTVAEATTEM